MEKDKQFEESSKKNQCYQKEKITRNQRMVISQNRISYC